MSLFSSVVPVLYAAGRRTPWSKMAHAAQNRAVGLTLAITTPFFVAFLILPEVIMAGLFKRGAA